MSAPLAAHTAVVTGASRGIGLATARALASAGARVVMIARGQETLFARAREVGEAAIPLACDVTDPAAVARAATGVAEAFGAAPDVLVNSAGLFPMAPIVETSAESFAETIAANLVAPFLLVRALLPGMTERGRGHIVTVGSVADRTIFPGNGAYAASKFGARALHEVLRAELRGTGVRTTLVSPAATDTPIWDALDPDARADLPNRADMLRPEDVADAILYAISRAPAVNIDELRLSRS